MFVFVIITFFFFFCACCTHFLSIFCRTLSAPQLGHCWEDFDFLGMSVHEFQKQSKSKKNDMHQNVKGSVSIVLVLSCHNLATLYKYIYIYIYIEREYCIRIISLLYYLMNVLASLPLSLYIYLTTCADSIFF